MLMMLWVKKKTVVVTSDPLVLIVEKIKVSKRKEKVIFSSDSEGSDADDFSELKKINALLAKAFNRRKFYSKPTNNNLRTSSASQIADKKQEYVKSDDKKFEKKDDEKKRDMSKVKCLNCKKEGHFAKDCKKAKVKDYEYYETKMLLAKKDKDEQVLLAEDHAWMESSIVSYQEINENMVFMAKIKKVISYSEASTSSADNKILEESYYLSKSESKSDFETSEYYDNTTTYEKAMYGLHQAPKAWYGTLSKYLLDNGFQREKRREGFTQKNAPNMEGWIKREDLLVRDTMKDSDKSADKGSDSTNAMANVLGTLGATNILDIGGLRLVFTTAILSVATASTIVSPTVATASRSFPTTVIFTTARKMTEPEQPSKEKVLEQMSAQLARDLEAKSNEIVAKYLSEYEQAEAGLSHDEKVKLIDELLMYQRNLDQIKKYQAQQNKPAIKTKRRDFYMSILRSNTGWKAKDFKGMTFEQIEEKFIIVWEKMQDFVPMNSKLESKRLKRPGI
uniref:Putative ribonuclease H-like domain-containing protein n=1 Tax=Tanacetum cinerariifolium TaxID=118510 RepID=A0A699IEI7_TANCI|nr:putative ribonuclease H-like domain-containing protein [Tanacetum cinerariifolium]